MSLATRLRALKVLSGLGKEHLNDPKKLKSLLCPVIARTPAEQDRFYDLFDRYVYELYQPLPEPPPEPVVQWWERIPKAFWGLLGILSLLLLANAIYQFSQPKPPPFKAHFKHDKSVKIGDTLKIINHSERMDTSRFHFTWEILNSETEAVEHSEKESYHWYHVIHEKETDQEKIIRLTVQQKNLLDSIYIHQSRFKIHCVQAPAIQRIEVLQAIKTSKRKTQKIVEKVKEDEAFTLTAVMAQDGDYRYEWDLGQGIVKTGKEVEHRYAKQGNYTIRLTVEDLGANGICQNTLNHQLIVGAQKAYLNPKIVAKDDLEILATFSWGMWLFMLGWLGIVLYNLWRWFKRKAPIREEETDSTEVLEEQFKSYDQAPYFIPFRSKNGQIKSERDLFRFADVLRLRQEGLRQYINVPKTITKTIQEGGFPKLRYSTRTQPSEYLFLIDQQSTYSHQTKLFEYLAELMKEKDIYAEVYWYKNSFHRFWNEEHPDGFSLSLLHRLYPHHRLFVMGDGHDLQDPFPQGQPALKKPMVAHFKRWKERFLLSPLPPESWTYREELLYGMFSVFPATLEGLNESSTFLERVLDQEDVRPTFKHWRDIFLKPPHEPDVNYRKWRKANDHRKYLTEHPKVYQWLCALAVYQQPTWEITIAIGKALQPLGVKVTFDNLCLLARIPWLQSGDLAPRLRQEFLNELTPEAEQLARASVKKELEAVKELTGNGHANRELNTNLAIQNFAIAPDEINHQKIINFLLTNGLLNKKQIAELNHTVDQYQSKNQTSTLEKKSRPTDKGKLKDFLDQQTADQKPLPKPTVTRHLIQAILAGFLFLLLLFVIQGADRTTSLRLLFFDLDDNPAKDQPLKSNFLVKEVYDNNPAKVHNNQGVDSINNISAHRNGLDINNWFLQKIDWEQSAIKWFDKATTEEPNYTLAKNNRTASYYNMGSERYQAFLNDSVDFRVLETAIPYFRLATVSSAVDSLKWDSWHALGLAYFYLEQRDSAQQYLNRIIEEVPRYFIDLDQTPNLQTLLPAGPQQQERIVSGQVVDQRTRKGINRVIIRSPGLAGRTTDRNGYYSISLPADFNATGIDLSFIAVGYNIEEVKVKVTSVDSLETILMTLKNESTIGTVEGVAAYQGANGLYGLLSESGKVIFPPSYIYIGYFPESLAYFITKDNKIGYLNQLGEIIIPAKYDVLGAQAGFENNACPLVLEDLPNFSNGLALVRKGNYFGYINTSGEEVIPLQYDFATPFGYCHKQPFKVLKSGTTINNYDKFWKGPAQDGEAFVVLHGEKSYFIDSNGDCVRGCEDQTIANTFTDPRDNQTYRTVRLNDQVWMAENINYQGTASGGKTWCYDNQESNCTKYGRLYDWEAAKKACPSGWHLPTLEEVKTLLNYTGGYGTIDGDVGKPEVSYQRLIEGGSSKFDALMTTPYINGKFIALFWTSTEKASNEAEAWGLIDQKAGIIVTLKDVGLSCRCIQGLAPPESFNPVEQRTDELPSVSDMFAEDGRTYLFFDNETPQGKGTSTSEPYIALFVNFLANKKLYYSEIPSKGLSAKLQKTIFDEFFKIAEREYKEFTAQLDALYKELLSGKGKEVVLYGHASRILSDQSEKDLSARRVSSVVLEILAFKDRVFQPYIDSGQLVIRELPEESKEATGAVSELLNKKKPFDIQVIRKRKVEVEILTRNDGIDYNATKDVQRPSLYIREDDDIHYFVILFSGNDISFNNAETSISDFNKKYYRSEEYIIAALHLDQEKVKPILVLRYFKNKENAMDYFDIVRNYQQEFLPPKVQYQFYPITQNNYETAIKARSFEGYEKFFKENYLK